MASITFSGTLAQIQAQVLEFVGLTDAQYAAATAQPASGSPAPAHKTEVALPIPGNAPAGSYWVATPGAPSLRDAAGNVLAVDWTATPPVVVPNPPRTPDGGSLSGKDFLGILTGNTGG